METLRKPVNFMYFWLNYCDKNHIEKIPVAVKNTDHLFNLASEMIGADNLHLFLLFDATRIDNNEYLNSLENDTELIVCTEEKIQKLVVYFELKRYLSFKNLLSFRHRLFYVTLDCSLMFIEAVLCSTCLSLVQSVLQ